MKPETHLKIINTVKWVFYAPTIIIMAIIFLLFYLVTDYMIFLGKIEENDTWNEFKDMLKTDSIMVFLSLFSNFLIFWTIVNIHL